MKLIVSSTVGQNGTLTVQDEVFGLKVNADLIAQAVRVYLANQRQGSAKTKTRSEINRTKKKWFKQKGTGNARHGARTPSLFVGGGVAHGPHGNQNWILKMSTTMRRRALAAALSAQVKNIVVCDDLTQLDGKTASAHKLLRKMLPNAKHVLVVLAKPSALMMRSLQNLEYVYLTTASRLNTYETSYADAIVMTKDAVKELEDRLAKPSTKAAQKVEAVIAKEEVKVAKPVKAVAKLVKKSAAKTKIAKKTKKV